MTPKIAKNTQPEGRRIDKGWCFELLIPTPTGGVQHVGQLEVVGVDPVFGCVVAVLELTQPYEALNEQDYRKILYRIRP